MLPSNCKINKNFLYNISLSVEYTFQSIASFTAASKCGAEHRQKVFYFLTYPQIFQKYPKLYHPLVGFIAKIMSYITSITWAYRDIFLINISLAFDEKFHLINQALFESKNEPMLPSFYWKYRQVYAQLGKLVDKFDESINTLIMLAFAHNTFVICAFLFSSTQ